ncbi:MAG: prephenate dehydrogenase/arogenate dehydrogenase family protein [Deltaproteobacteria bacterium]|nr:prephenate dehydrogenase/arogenate dehydrogenase family protein [Deltaproteobacteria bacterium]
MAGIEIGIIGGTGGMGAWFAEFFKREGYVVHVSGRRTGLGITALAGRCDVVIVSVPIDATLGVIEQAGPFVREEALFMDFTSLKAEPVRAMLAHSRSEVIGLHPLFGPDVASAEGQNIVYCPVRTKRWLPWLLDVLGRSGARLKEATPEKHDGMMALVQGLNHLNTITLGLALREAGVTSAELEDFSTPIFRTKMAFVDKVFRGNPGLYAEIITGNRHIGGVVELYERQLARVRTLIGRRDAASLAALIGEDEK